jgi:hypothetical protein
LLFERALRELPVLELPDRELERDFVAMGSPL